MSIRSSSISLSTCRSRRATVTCRASWMKGNAAAAAVAATLLMASPVLAVSSTFAPANPSLTYEEELEQAILKRTGRKEVLPELTEIPNEKAIQREVDQAFINEANAEQAVETAEPLKAEGIKGTVIKTKVSSPAPSVKTSASSGAEDGNNNVLIIGALAVAGVGAAIALSGGSSSGESPAPPATPVAPATPAAAPPSDSSNTPSA